MFATANVQGKSFLHYYAIHFDILVSLPPFVQLIIVYVLVLLISFLSAIPSSGRRPV
jgi:hypothetical protein